MYFSFSPSPPATTSYSTAPMNIPSTSNSRSQSPSCAYPSWPRRSSLSSNSSSSCEDEAAHSSSYITDEELFPCVFDDAEQDCTPPATPSLSRSPASPNMIGEGEEGAQQTPQEQQQQFEEVEEFERGEQTYEPYPGSRGMRGMVVTWGLSEILYMISSSNVYAGKSNRLSVAWHGITSRRILAHPPIVASLRQKRRSIPTGVSTRLKKSIKRSTTDSMKMRSSMIANRDSDLVIRISRNYGSPFLSIGKAESPILLLGYPCRLLSTGASCRAWRRRGRLSRLSHPDGD